MGELKKYRCNCSAETSRDGLTKSSTSKDEEKGGKKREQKFDEEKQKVVRKENNKRVDGSHQPVDELTGMHNQAQAKSVSADSF